MAEDQHDEREFKPALNPGDLSNKTDSETADNFTYASVHELGEQAFQSASPAEMYDMLADVATQQGFGDLADSLQRRAQSPVPTISTDPDGIVMKLRGSLQDPEVDGSKEQVMRRRIAKAIGLGIHGLRQISRGDTNEDGTPTLADVQLDSNEDKQLMVALCQVLAENPVAIETTEPFVKIYGSDDENGQRYDIQTVPSTVGGYDLVLWRHGRSGRTTRTDKDMVKIFLRKIGAEVR